MKITTTSTITEEYGFKRETNFSVVIESNGKRIGVGFGEGEPEDMNLARDLSGAYDIPNMLRLAYEAGKRNEPIEEINENQ